MKPLVVDSGVAIRWFQSHMDHQTQALNIFNRLKEDEFQLIEPDLIYAEFGNILWKMTRFQGLKPETARRSIVEFATLQMTIVSNANLFADAYSIATHHNRSVYDCLYIALAQREKCTFVTADEKLFNAVGSQLPVTFIANWS